MKGISIDMSIDRSIDRSIDLSIDQFLLCETPDSWLEAAVKNLPVLLIDHANCEKKAAATAMNLIYKYIDKPDLLQKLSRLAREELRHFEQVLNLMSEMNIEYVHVSSSRYAGKLRKNVRTHEPARLIDLLIVGAIVEARSCERFGKLIKVLAKDEPELSLFYQSLLKSENRHFRDYLGMAQAYAKTEMGEESIDDRVHLFLLQDQALIASEDSEFRFHSGLPQGNSSR